MADESLVQTVKRNLTPEVDTSRSALGKGHQLDPEDSPQQEGQQLYDENFGSPAQQAYGKMKNFLAKHEEHFSDKVLKPFREGLDRMGDDLVEKGLDTHIPLLAAAGGALKAVPVGANVKDTAAALVVPPELGEEGALSKAFSKLEGHEVVSMPQGGHAGGGVASVEELNRPGRFVKVSKSGSLTDQGKTPDFNLKPGEAGYHVTEQGPKHVAGEESEPTKRGAGEYHKEVFGKKEAAKPAPERLPKVENLRVPPERTTGEFDAPIKKGGAIPGGIQKGDPELNLKDLALFHDPATGSTLALPVDRVTPEAIAKELKKSRDVYIAAEDSKAAATKKPGQAEEMKAQAKQKGTDKL